MEDTLFRCNREPTLDEILAEPIVQAVMRRDGVDETTIRRLIRTAARAKPPKLAFIPPAPAREEDSDPPQASIGVLAQAQAAAEPRWPRVFPSL
jgi:hypothetical protein